MIETVDIAIDGMRCEGCVASARNALLRLDGVAEATPTLEGGRATVVYDPARVAVADLKAAVEAAGFDAP